MITKLISTVVTHLLFLVFILTINNYAQWEVIDTGTNIDFCKITFADSLRGWAMGQYRIVHTDNGGLSWSEQVLPSDSIELRDCAFPAKDVGYIIGREGLILATKDGGESWIKQNGPKSHFLLSTNFISEDEGWITGGISNSVRGGILLHTSNGGVKWDTVDNRSDGIIYYSVKFRDRDNGIILGSYGFDNFDPTYIYKTEDGGKSLHKISEFNGAFTLKLYMNYTDTLWAGGFGFARSFDNGLTWTTSFRLETIDTSFGLIIFVDLLNLDNKNGWACISNVRGPYNSLTGLFRTDDFGYTWKYLETPLGPQNYCLAYSDNNLFVGGGEGLIIKRKQEPTDVQEDNPLISSIELYQNYPNPFNPVTNISYYLPAEGIVEIKVYDLLGNEIAVPERGYKTSGFHKVVFDGSMYSSGIYFYQLKTGNYFYRRKMLLIK